MNTGMFRSRGRLPDRIELGIVELQARAVGLLDGQAEVLHDLAEAERAGLDVGFELLRRSSGPNPGPTLRRLRLVNITIRSL